MRQRGSPLSLFGDDIDDAAHRLRAIKRTLGASQHLYPLNILRQQISEIELVAGCGIIHLDAVDHDQRMVAFRTADADLREVADRTGAVDGDTGDSSQRIGNENGLLLLKLLRRDDGHGAADLIERRVGAVCRNGKRRHQRGIRRNRLVAGEGGGGRENKCKGKRGRNRHAERNRESI